MSAVTGILQAKSLAATNRFAAVGLIIIQAAVVSLLMQPVMVPVTAIALVGLLAPRLRLQFQIPVGLSFCAIAAYCAYRYQTRDEDFLPMGFIGSKLAYELTCACLGCQLVMLFVKKYAQQIPSWFLAISGTGLVFSGDIRVTYKNAEIVLWLILAYMAFWMLFTISSRRMFSTSPSQIWMRRVVVVSVTILGIISGRVLAQNYQKYANRVEFWMSEYLYHGRVTHMGNGFSGRGGLYDISELKMADGDSVALRVEADFCPDYLRGRVFTTFHQIRWQPSEPVDVISSVPDHPPIRELYPDESVFMLEKEWPQSPKTMVVWPFDHSSAAHFFLPLGAAVLGCDGRSIKRDPYGIVERDSKSLLDSYVALIGDPPRISRESISPEFLQLPNPLSPVVTRTAEEIFAGKTTAQEKMRAVEAFFHNNFTYKIGLRIPRGTDRLAYFLTVRPPAHCEYFATATAILLRAGGVPARYVTGYVISGRNPVDNSYFALRRNAHAWVEAYDDVEQRWVIVESTPMEGVPAREEQTSLQVVNTFGWAKFLEISEVFRSGIVWKLGEKYVRAMIYFVPLVAALYFLVKILISRLSAPRRREFQLPESLRPLARERARMDRFLARRGYSRSPEESVLHFARRLEGDSRLTTAEELAEWYRQYATIRFQDRPVDVGWIESIRDARLKLIRTTRLKS